MKLVAATSPAWLDTVLADFDTFLVDHAACERKASATGMLFVVRYPDRTALIEPLIEYAREELQHFARVVREVHDRGLRLAADVKEPYAGRLLAEVRHGRNERLLDRLLVAGILEARGCERFGMVARALPVGPLRELYLDFARADAAHQRLFLDLAGHWFDEPAIARRLAELLAVEAEFVRGAAPRPALYG